LMQTRGATQRQATQAATMAQQNNMIAQLQTALVNTPPNSPGGTPMTPNRLAVQAIPQPAIQNAPQVVPIAPPVPRCGGLLQLGTVMVPWVGGGAVRITSKIHQPVSSLAYRAPDLSMALKVEKACSEGLPEARHLPAPGLTDVATATASVTFAEWLYMIRMTLIERGLDCISSYCEQRRNISVRKVGSSNKGND
jgi:hypothetical protein